MTLVFNLLSAQALLGAFDNLWHHEIKERLPSRRSAAGELALHTARELIYALVDEYLEAVERLQALNAG